MNITKVFGLDQSLDISLFEYQLIAVKNQHCNDNELMFIAVNSYDNKLFSTGYINTEEISTLLKGNEWIDKKDLNLFFEYYGYEMPYFLIHSIKRDNYLFFKVVSNLISYFGLENFITDYSPVNLDTLNEWFKGVYFFEVIDEE